jgi:hypothetical protein
MSGHARISGKTFAKITLGGKTWTIRPAKLGSFGELEAYYLSLLQDPVVYASQRASLIPREQHEALFKSALDLASKLKIVNAQQLSEFENSLRGIAFKVYVAFREEHPDLDTQTDAKDTRTKVERGVDNALLILESITEAEMEALLAQVDSINMTSELGNSSGQPPKETEAEAGPTSTSGSPPNTTGTQNELID